MTSTGEEAGVEETIMIRVATECAQATLVNDFCRLMSSNCFYCSSSVQCEKCSLEALLRMC